MSKRGQALVEFVIILPIFLILVLGVLDIGKILYCKTSLENDLSEVMALYEKGLTEEEIVASLDLDNVELAILKEDNMVRIYLTEEVDIVTPGLNFILDNPYYVKVSRSYYE